MENKRLFGKICYLHRQMRRENNALFSEYGVTPVQMSALVNIRKMEDKRERVCQKDIEKSINLRASSVSTLLCNLERDGFITRNFSDGDARSKSLCLTERGKEVVEKDKLFMDKCDKMIESALTESEQKEFDRLICKIISSISK